MSLTFREQAAIALYAMRPTKKFEGYDSEEVASLAQNLAETACVQWGHDRTIGEAMANERCKRCGAEPNGEENRRAVAPNDTK